MIKTNVYNEEGKYVRHGELSFEDDEIVFDTAGGEYGIHRLPISIFMKALEEHKQIQNESKRI